MTEVSARSSRRGTEVAEALDRIEIQHVIASYSEAIDNRDWEALEEVFTADAQIDYTEMGGIRGDLPTIKAFLDASLGDDGRYARTQHLLGQSYVRIDGDTASARTACFNPMIVDAQVGDDGMDVMHFCGLWYRDKLVRTPAGWRIAERYEQRTYKYGKAAPSTAAEAGGH
jgi:hypothetical protein